MNVGAGTGSYEPAGRRVTALEPHMDELLAITKAPPPAATAALASSASFFFVPSVLLRDMRAS